MFQCKIKVVELTVRNDLAAQLQAAPVTPCPIFSVGQEWLLSHYGRPLDFCENAWTAIHRMVYAVMTGVGSEITAPCWVEDGRRAVVCCNDGLRPVVFELTRIGSKHDG